MKNKTPRTAALNWSVAYKDSLETKKAMQANLLACQQLELENNHLRFHLKQIIDHANMNKSIRDNVDDLLRQARFSDDCSIRHQLSMMNFDSVKNYKEYEH